MFDVRMFMIFSSCNFDELVVSVISSDSDSDADELVKVCIPSFLIDYKIEQNRVKQLLNYFF